MNERTNCLVESFTIITRVKASSAGDESRASAEPTLLPMPGERTTRAGSATAPAKKRKASSRSNCCSGEDDDDVGFVA